MGAGVSPPATGVPPALCQGPHGPGLGVLQKAEGSVQSVTAGSLLGRLGPALVHSTWLPLSSGARQATGQGLLLSGLKAV